MITSDSSAEEGIFCPCSQWAREVNLSYPTTHHPDCPHYNDSLIDVWRVGDGVTFAYIADDAEIDTEGLDQVCVSKVRIHREVFERLPEFNGY